VRRYTAHAGVSRDGRRCVNLAVQDAAVDVAADATKDADERQALLRRSAPPPQQDFTSQGHGSDAAAADASQDPMLHIKGVLNPAGRGGSAVRVEAHGVEATLTTQSAALAAEFAAAVAAVAADAVSPKVGRCRLTL
jgi:hypothetical protein